VNNVETLACIPHILNKGAQWFKDLALTPEAAGTKIFCISGRSTSQVLTNCPWA
jgi:NADH-quinone oxidoreductase subunit F